MSASPCRAKVAKGAARHISVTPYPARKDTRASGPLAPLELPGEEMPGCLGARTLGYYHCNKEPGQPVGRHALRGVCLGSPVFSFIARTRSDPGDCNATTPVFPRPLSRLQSPLKQRFAPPRRAIHTRQLARSLSLALHLTTLLRDGPLRRPQRRYTALAGGSACPVATAPYLPIARIPLSRRGR